MWSRRCAVLAALLLTMMTTTASAATCTWTGGSGAWNDPAHWTGCSGGNGTVPDTPGLGDDAIVNAPGARIDLLDEVLIDSLQFSAGTIAGLPNLLVADLQWSGGEFEGDQAEIFPSTLVIGNSANLTGTLYSKNRFISAEDFAVITLQNGADLEIERTSGFGAPCGPLPFSEICIGDNAQMIVQSSLVNTSEIRANLGNQGELIIAVAPAILQMQSGFIYTQSAASRLELMGGQLQQLGAGATLGFAGGEVRGIGTLAADRVEFFSAKVEPAYTDPGILNIVAATTTFQRNSWVVFDVVGPASFDRINASGSSVDFNGVIEIRSSLPSSTDTYALISAANVLLNEQAFDTALTTHQLSAGSGLSLEPFGGLSCVWTGSIDDDFNGPSNWSNCGSGSPGSNDLAIIDLPGATVNVGSNSSLARLKFASTGGSLTIALDQQLNVNQYFKWISGTVNTSGSNGALHLNFASLGVIGDPTGTRTLNGNIANGAKLAMDDRFAINLGSGALFDNAAELTFINSANGSNNTFSSGQFRNNGTLLLLEGASFQMLSDFQQTPGGQLVVREGSAEVKLVGIQSGNFVVDGGELKFTGSGAQLDGSSNVQVNGDWHIQAPIQVAGSLNARSINVTSSNTLTINSISPIIDRLFIDSGAVVQGSAPIIVNALVLQGGEVRGDSGGTQTFSVNRLMEVDGSGLISPVVDRQLTLNGTSLLLLHPDNTLQVSNLGSLDVGGEVRIGADAGGFERPSRGGIETATISGDGSVRFRGLLRVDPNQVLELAGSYQPALDLGTPVFQISQSGTLRRSVLPLILDGGTVRGRGTIEADLTLDNGELRPGDFDDTPGLFFVNGDLTLGNNQNVILEFNGVIPGTQHDQLQITGTFDAQDPDLDIRVITYYVPQALDTFTIATFADVGGSLFGSTLNPLFGLHEVVYNGVPPAATALVLQPSAGAGAAVCIWNGADDDWDNALNWIDCAGGTGVPLQTPGPADTAIVNGGIVSLVADVSVGELQLNGGTIDGNFNLLVENNLLWTGGTVEASSTVNVLRVQAAATATLQGGQKNISNRDVQILGNGIWTTGLINFIGGGRFTIDTAAELVVNPGVPTEQWQGPGQLAIAGTLRKSGSGSTAIDTGVTASGAGTLIIEGGTLTVRGPALGVSWAIETQAGGTLEFVDQNHGFGLASSFIGAGTLRFGDNVSASNNTIAGSFSHSGPVVVGFGELEFATTAAGVSLGSLALTHPGSAIDGDDNLVVTSSLDWQAGTIRGSGAAQSLTVAATATANLTMPSTRTLSTRQLINQGTLNFSGVLQMGDNAELRNENQMQFNSTGFSSIIGSGANPRLVNLQPGSSLILNGTGTLNIGSVTAGQDIAFTNNGTVTINSGQLSLFNDGTDSGNYFMNDPGILRAGGTGIRTIGNAASQFSGTGAAQFSDNSVTNLRGNVSISKLRIDNSATVDLDGNGAFSSVDVFEMSGGSLRGNDDLVVTTNMQWGGGLWLGTGTQRVIFSGLTGEVFSGAMS